MTDQQLILTSIGAAHWAAKFYANRSHSRRQLSSIAGQVVSQVGSDESEVIAAWMYRPCEDLAKDNAAQALLLQEVDELCGDRVGFIVRELVVPIKSNETQTKQRFVLSCDSAKRIRIAEVMVGLDASFVLMYGGAAAKIEEVRNILKFARFVYESSPTVHKDIRRELISLIISVENMWNSIMSTVESFEHLIGAPEMVPVRLIAVVNDLGTVKIAKFEGDPDQVKVRSAFDALRKEIGGNLFSETLFHATVPVPKVDVLKPIPPSLPQPSAAAS